MKLGLLITHSDNYFALKYDIPNRYSQGLKDLASKHSVDVVVYGPIKDGIEAEKARAFFEEEKVAYLLILNADFSTGDIMLAFDGYSQPMGVWAVEDPYTQGDIQLNSTVSTNLYISIAQRKFISKKEVKWFYGDPKGTQFQSRMDVTIRALRAYHAWSHKTIGILGDVAPTFYNLENDCSYEKDRGCSFVYLEMKDLICECEKISEQECKEMEQIILDSANDTTKLPRESLVTGARVTAALCHLCDKYHIDALAACCWPDFQDTFSIVPCVPFTLLGKIKNVPVACEGDITGALSLLLAKEISGSIPTLMDVTSINAEDNTLMLWHCGIGSHDLQPSLHSSIISHPMLDRKNPNRKLMGLSYDYALKSTKVTILRYSNSSSVFAVNAEIMPNDKGFTGTRGYISNFHLHNKEIGVNDVIQTLMHHGIEHHLIICEGQYAEAFQEMSKYLNLDWLSIMPYQDSL